MWQIETWSWLNADQSVRAIHSVRWRPSTHSSVSVSVVGWFHAHLHITSSWFLSETRWALRSGALSRFSCLRGPPRRSSAGVKRGESWEPLRPRQAWRRGAVRGPGSAVETDRQAQLQGVCPQGKLKKTGSTLGRAHHSIMSHPVISYCQLCFEISSPSKTVPMCVSCLPLTTSSLLSLQTSLN